MLTFSHISVSFRLIIDNFLKDTRSSVHFSVVTFEILVGAAKHFSECEKREKFSFASPADSPLSSSTCSFGSRRMLTFSRRSANCHGFQREIIVCVKSNALLPGFVVEKERISQEYTLREHFTFMGNYSRTAGVSFSGATRSATSRK